MDWLKLCTYIVIAWWIACPGIFVSAANALAEARSSEDIAIVAANVASEAVLSLHPTDAEELKEYQKTVQKR
jgi:hypothetical protein